MHGVRFMIYGIHMKLIKHRNLGIAIQNIDIFRKGTYSVRHNSRPIVSDGLLWLTDK